MSCNGNCAKDLPETIPRTIDWSLDQVSKDKVGVAGIEYDKKGISLNHTDSCTPIIAFINGIQIQMAFYDARFDFRGRLNRLEQAIRSAKTKGVKLDNLLLDLR